VVAGNLAGPRRIKSGAARDHFLGFTGVSGRGEVFKGGGQVVKNVTGYDLPKLMAGSWGTLAALAEVTLKVLPQPEEARTVVVLGLDDATATRALAGALNSRHEISGAAHLPAPVAARSAIGAVAEAGKGVTALRLEGPAPSVAHRAEAASTIWRVSVAPSAGAAVAAAIAAALDATWFFDWGGGLLWVAVRDGAGDGGEALLRNAVRAAGGGHATLLRGPESLRAAIAVFEPQPAPVAALTARVKDAFDPRRILNPGRVYRGC
jgi:glycolate oxidase FAD binding subunit